MLQDFFTQTEGQDINKLIIAFFRNCFAKAPKKYGLLYCDMAQNKKYVILSKKYFVSIFILCPEDRETFLLRSPGKHRVASIILFLFLISTSVFPAGSVQGRGTPLVSEHYRSCGSQAGVGRDKECEWACRDTWWRFQYK